MQVSVIGIGRCGFGAINYLLKQYDSKLNHLFIYSDFDYIRLKFLEENRCHHLDLNTTGTVEIEKLQEKIALNISKKSLVFLVSASSGIDNSSLFKFTARLLKDMNYQFIPLAVTPCNYEGLKRRKISKECLSSLSQNTNLILTFSNEEMLRSNDKDLPAGEAYEIVFRELKSIITSISKVKRADLLEPMFRKTILDAEHFYLKPFTETEL